MADITIPKQYYVTKELRKDVKTETGHLGFASPYTKDAAFEKRKATQDKWAYGYGCKVVINPEDDSVTVEAVANNSNIDLGMLFMTNGHPIIFDNLPVDGFCMSSSVKRGGRWGAGDTKWRISDPRGFELEISSANFANVINCSTVENGLIKDKCVWGRNGKDNVLLPVSSDVYQAAETVTNQVNQNLTVKDVQAGDTIRLFNKGVNEENKVCQYLGKYYFLTVDTANYEHRFNTKQTARYLLRSIATNEYFVVVTPQILEIIEKIDTPIDRESVAQEVTRLSDGNSIDGIYDFILASTTSIKLNAVTTSLVPLTSDEMPTNSNWKISSQGFSPLSVITEYKGRYYVAARGTGIPNTVRGNLLELSLPENKVTVVTRKSFLNRYQSDDYATEDIPNVTSCPMFLLAVTVKNITSKVFRFGYF